MAAALAGLALPRSPWSLVLALVGGGIWAVWFSSWLAVETIDVSGAQTVEAADIRGPLAASTSASRWPASTWPRPSAGSARWPWSAPSTVTRQWPNGILVSLEERVAIAVVEIGGRLRGMDADGVVFRDYKKAPPGCRAS